MNEFEKDLYNAFSDVMFKYIDYPIAEPDHQNDVKEIMNKLIDKFYDTYEYEEEV